MNKFFLYLVARFSPFWAALGANTRQLHLILETKLKMSDRQPPPLWAGRQQHKKANNNTLALMLMAVIYGALMMTVLVLMGDNMLTALTVYFFLFIVMLAMLLVTDFTSVLFDSRDNHILLSRPVNDRTVLLARLIHITIHLCKIVIPMTLPATVYIFITDGIPEGGLLILLNILSIIFTVFLVNLVYLLILNITSPARFKNIINYIQILFTIALFAAYQVIPRILQGDLTHADVTQYPWMFFVPPFWLGAVWEVVINHHWQQPYLIPAALAFAAPLLSIWIVVRFLAPSFNKRLSAINSPSESNPEGLLPDKETQPASVIERLASILSRDKIQRATFLFCWRMTSRSRDLKLKLYPSYGYFIVFFFIYFFMSKGELSEKLAFFKKGPVIISVIYFSIFIVITAISFIRFSEKYKAAWIYHIAPIARPGQLFAGVLKALLLKYFVPLYFLTILFILFVKGIVFIPNLLLGLANMIFISLLFSRYYLKSLPFSTQWDSKQSSASASVLVFFVLMLVDVIIGVFHYLIMDFTIAVIIATLLATIASWLLLDSFRNKTWDQIMGKG